MEFRRVRTELLEVHELVECANGVLTAVLCPGGSHFGQFLTAHGLATLLLKIAGGDFVTCEAGGGFVQADRALNSAAAGVNDALRPTEKRHNVLWVQRDTVKHDFVRCAEPLRALVVGRTDIGRRQPLEGGREAVGVPAGDNPERPTLHDQVAGRN